MKRLVEFDQNKKILGTVNRIGKGFKFLISEIPEKKLYLPLDLRA